MFLASPWDLNSNVSVDDERKEIKEIYDDFFFDHPVETVLAGLTQESYLFPVGPEPRRQSYGINTLTYSFSKLLPFQP